MWDYWSSEKDIGYMLLDFDTKCVIHGGNLIGGYKLSLDEAKEFINQYEE